jgi:hypothetical protein
MNPSATPDSRSIDEEINKQIQNTLQPGETVLWTCKASVKNAIQGELIGRYIGNCVLILAIFVVIVGFFESIILLIVGGLLISFMGFFFLRDLPNPRKKLEKTVYVVTDQHAIIVGPTVEIYPIDLLRQTVRRRYDDGSGSLLFYRYYAYGVESEDVIYYSGFDEINQIANAEMEIDAILSKNFDRETAFKWMTDGTIRLTNPSETEITSFIDSLQCKYQYLLISRGKNDLLWIVISDVLNFIIEYRDPKTNKDIWTKAKPWDRDKVISLIIKYLNDDDEWKNSHRFEGFPNPEPKKSVPKPESNDSDKLAKAPRPWFGRLVCVTLVIGGAGFFIDDLFFERRAKETIGEVVSTQSDGEAIFRVVKFHVGGKSYQSKMGWGSSHPSFAIGDNVIVLYDPNDLRDPPRAKMKGLQTETKMMVGCFVLTLFLVSIIYYLRIRSNIKIRKIVGLESRFLEIPRNPT